MTRFENPVRGPRVCQDTRAVSDLDSLDDWLKTWWPGVIPYRFHRQRLGVLRFFIVHRVEYLIRLDVKLTEHESSISPRRQLRCSPVKNR